MQKEDFYLFNAGNCLSWVGSVNIKGGSNRSIDRARSEEEYLESVNEYLKIHNGTAAAWPWSDSKSTGRAYMFYHGKVWQWYEGSTWYNPSGFDGPLKFVVGVSLPVMTKMMYKLAF